jgi:tripartite-type tricarboxylate transporter receptor subunit TctC
MLRLSSLKKLGMSAICAIGIAVPAVGQDYPTRPITFIYPYAAGSNPDTTWRLLVNAASKKLGQPIVYQNKPGAAARVGFEQLTHAAPDGYTIGSVNSVLTVFQPLADPKMATDPDVHYTAILPTFTAPLVLVARADLPFDDVKGMIAYAKKNPGKLRAADTGPGGGSHLGIVVLNQRAGIDIQSIHYQGTAPGLQALLSGEADMILADISAKPHVDAGTLKILGNAGVDVYAPFPKAATIESQGLPGYRNESWNSLGAPLSTPPAIVQKIRDAFNAALQDPEVRDAITSRGWKIMGGSDVDVKKMIAFERDLYGPAIAAANK